MFKKTLIGLAVGAVAAGSAWAADVTVYGTVDAGLVYSNTKAKEKGEKAVKKDSFSMESGTNSGSRFGLKGSEDLGNGMSVGFVLENGFASDSGQMTDNRLFGREASLSLKGGFGTLYAGRMGALVSDAGSVGFYGAMASSLGSGWSSNIAGHTAVMADYVTRRDNTLTYVSPEFAGTTFYAQYAMGDNGKENKPSTDRYAALGAKWENGPLAFGALVDWTNKDSSKLITDGKSSVDDALTYNLAASYDFGLAKTYLAVQYFDKAADAGSMYKTIGGSKPFSKYHTMTGYGVHLGADASAMGGIVKAGIGYMDADAEVLGKKIGDAQVYTAGLGYEYSLSQRTRLYTGAGYVEREAKGAGSKFEQKGFDVAAGLVHKF